MNEKIEDSYKHFANVACRFYPCHQLAEPGSFNCLFCYCPLFMLGDKCGGDYRYNDKGVKDCSACLLPHTANGYDYVTSSFSKIVASMKNT